MAENLVYRGHPLRRVDNLVYYGSMADKYIIMMQVLDTAIGILTQFQRLPSSLAFRRAR